MKFCTLIGACTVGFVGYCAALVATHNRFLMDKEIRPDDGLQLGHIKSRSSMNAMQAD